MSLVRVGILAPMPSELRPVVKAMGLTRDADGLHVGRVGAVDVVAMRTGMGLALATAAATRLLDHTAVDHVMVVGIAGGLGSTLVGELVCPEIVVERSTATEFRATPFASASGRISSSDEFALESDLVDRLAAAGVRAVDMETAAVAAVCAARGCAWSAVRVISDLVEDHPDAAVLGLANADGSPNAAAALRFMAAHPGRIPQLLRLGRDASRAARAAAAEAARQLRAIE